MKYVDADALADRLENLAYDDWNQGIRLTWADACTDLARIVRDDIPTVDAEPVRHGMWAKTSNAGQDIIFCSECGYELPRVNSFDPQFDLFPKLKSIDKTAYCPNCGCKMDEVENETG